MIHHIKRATRHLIFWSLLIVAITLSGVRLVLMGVDSYKSTLETRISALVGVPVKLGSLRAKMRGVSPELVLKEINIAPIIATEKPSIQLKEIRLGINLGELLLSRDMLSSSWVTLVGAKLSVIRKQDGQITVEGLRAGNGQPLWLLQGRKYEVLQSHLTWQDQQKGGSTLVLDAVNLAIMNDSDHHRINMLTKLPEKYGDELKVAVDFEGSVDKPADIKGTVFVQGKNVKLHELASTYLPFEIRMTAGSTDFKVWGQWQQAQLISVAGDAQLRQVAFSRSGRGNFYINHLDTQFNGLTKDQQWLVDINRFLLESGGENKKLDKKWPDAIVSFAVEKGTNTGFQKLKMVAKQLDLAEFSKLLHFFAPLTGEQAQLLTQAQARGTLKDFSLYAEPQLKNFAIAGWFDSLSIEPLLTLPKIENISGKVKGSDKLGKVELASQNIHINLPQLFNKAVFFSQINGILAWQQAEDQWVLSSQAIGLNCPAFQSENRFLVRIPKNEEKPFIDLQIAFNSDDLSQVAAYLPTQIMKEKLKTWLSNAFVGGKLTKGDLLFYGKPKDFPFTDGTGVFEAKLDIDEVEIKFHPEWQPISGINGVLTIEKNSIQGLFNRGQIGKVDINKAEMLISDLGVDELLTIKGEGQGDINQILNVLQQSPQASRVNPVTAHTTIQGTAKATLDLTIPLRPGHEIKVDGNAKLNDAQLTVNRLALKIDKINGNLKFNKQGIYGDGIQAFTLGHPIKVNIMQADQQTLINVGGKVKVGDLENLFDWPKLQQVEGAGEYQFQLQIPSTDIENNPMQISVKSTLEGVALRLPGSLMKTKEQQKPTSLTFSLSDELALPIEFNYNNELKAAISLNSKERKINSGHILIGVGEARQRLASGIKLEINRDQLPLQEWLGIAATQQQTISSSLDISEIKIHSVSAMWKKTRLGAFDLALKRSQNFWAGEVDSTIANGKFQLPADLKGANAISFDMEMLNLSAIKQFSFQNAPATVSAGLKPLLNIHSKKTLWQSENLGELTLETVRKQQGMIIKRLELDGENEKLVMTGDWKDNGVTSTTHLAGRLNMKRADQLFDKLNITKDLTDTSGVIDFKLNWNAAPWQMSLPDLRGDMDVSLKNGRILSIDPGFGRVLGILAVAQWIKRLQLDFSDIYEEGLTYNSIKGHFDLLNGKATTKNLIIDAIPAKITILGDTDLVKQTVDHVIKVVPKSLDAVPIAGTIVGRVAAMVGKTLTGKDQEGFFFGTEYLVKGDWQDVKISSLHENDGLFQKTWNSITDFPWNEEEQQK
ncbi:YhdP family protein [Methyloglobulus sp.]|uniref:YhdP family protein n=1 Tax=Methyloglobulus sp. TaxID=2518622 RepID=UPI0032B7B013